ncbi:MAG: hypothetical protein JWN53_2404 [Gemmatimonadetes bacterium]|nr:hypothetical protein [Gemmatimonadota bacterium]
MSLSHSVLDAYRAAASRMAVELDDGSWARIGMLLEHAALLAPDERAPHLVLAAAAVRAAISDADWRRGHATDPPRELADDSLEGRLRVFAEQVEDAGAPEVADAILAAWLGADGTIPALERFRVESVRARLAWKTGDLDVAAERYRRVAAAARRLGSDELRARALIGEANVARQRGNFPRSRAAAARAARLAKRAGLRRLASLALQSLMVADAVAGALAPAIEHGWSAFLYAEGDEAMECAALGNVGQLFLDAGHPATAIAAFLSVIRRNPLPRILLPALGGMAIASARLGALADLRRATEQIEAYLAAGAAPYDAATVLLDLVRAHAIARDRVRATAFQLRTRELAQRHGYHEIEHRVDILEKDVMRLSPPGSALPPRTERVAGALRDLAGV